jgi:DNA polymerase III delta prime subunit
MDITKTIKSKIELDHWLLIIGYPGVGKSSLSLILYKNIMENLGYNDKEIKETWVYLDLLFTSYNYKYRLAYQWNELHRKPHPIILDDAQNILNITFVKKAYEIRKYRLVHIINTQMPGFLNKKTFPRINSLIYLWYYDVSPNNKKLYDKVTDYYKEYLDSKPGESKYIITFGYYFNKEKVAQVLRLFNDYDINNPGKIKIQPDAIFPMLFILHESNLIRKEFENLQNFDLTLRDKIKKYFPYKKNIDLFLRFCYQILNSDIKIEEKGDYYNLNSPMIIKYPKKIRKNLFANIGDSEIISSKSLLLNDNFTRFRIYSIKKDLYDFIMNNKDLFIKRQVLYKEIFT